MAASLARGIFVEQLVGVAEFHLCQRGFGERGLDRHHGLRFGLRGRRVHRRAVRTCGPRAPGIWRASPRSWGRSWCSSRDPGVRGPRRKRRRSPGRSRRNPGRSRTRKIGLLRDDCKCMRARTGGRSFRLLMPAMASSVVCAARRRPFRRQASSMQAPKKSPILARWRSGKWRVIWRPSSRTSPEELGILLGELAVHRPPGLEPRRNGVQLVPIKPQE